DQHARVVGQAAAVARTPLPSGVESERHAIGARDGDGIGRVAGLVGLLEVPIHARPVTTRRIDPAGRAEHDSAVHVERVACPAAGDAALALLFSIDDPVSTGSLAGAALADPAAAADGAVRRAEASGLRARAGPVGEIARGPRAAHAAIGTDGPAGLD